MIEKWKESITEKRGKKKRESYLQKSSACENHHMPVAEGSSLEKYKQYTGSYH